MAMVYLWPAAPGDPPEMVPVISRFRWLSSPVEHNFWLNFFLAKLFQMAQQPQATMQHPAPEVSWPTSSSWVSIVRNKNLRIILILIFLHFVIMLHSFHEFQSEQHNSGGHSSFSQKPHNSAKEATFPHEVYSGAP